ncbi:MAG: TAXI family TRAP transporter solute-binding subunit [Arenicellales bacterium]
MQWVPGSGVRLLGVAFAVLVLGASSFSAAAEMHLFRIATGGPGGTYYPVGNLIARAISQPPDAPPCADVKRCGVPGLVAVAQTANGSVANVKAVGAGRLESGFAQSDVAYWAYSHSGIFQDTEFYPNLRAIAGLYAETVHIVARKGASIHSVRDLAGKHVSLDEPGSGTLVDARLILRAYGLSEADIDPEYIKPTLASERIRSGDLDAFFIVAGFPVTSIRQLAESTDVTLVPIDGKERQRLIKDYRFFSSQSIRAGVYKGVGRTPSIGVRALWVTRSDMDNTLIYDITRALWNGSSRKLLGEGHPKAREIRLDTALDGVAIPLHPGAKRYYEEAGLSP